MSIISSHQLVLACFHLVELYLYTFDVTRLNKNSEDATTISWIQVKLIDWLRQFVGPETTLKFQNESLPIIGFMFL